MRVLVTGGAGYIGSVVVEQLLATDHTVFVLDNLWRGHASAITAGAELIHADIRDHDRVNDAVATVRPDAVMHFAAATLVPESMVEPALYYSTNVVGTHNLLASCREHGVDRFVMSSTAAVYGEPEVVPIVETSELRPINVYGRSKLMAEQMLESYAQAYGLRYAAFRYFNVAGASQARGEDHDPETHVIPVALKVLLGQRPAFGIFGTDYSTPDGSAIRDFVHVLDLARAHADALAHLDTSLGPINLGSRTGFSVLEIVEAVERVTGRSLPVERKPRRPGDPPRLIADVNKAFDVLGWRPEQSTLDAMIGSAWDWMQRYPNGYES